MKAPKTKFEKIFFTKIFLLIILIISAGNISFAQKKNSAKKHSCCSAETPEKEKFSDKSLYQLDAKWTTQDGKKIQLSQFKGKIPVLAMVYTSCTYACPRIVSDIKSIEEKIPAALREKIVFVLVSMDPERDTPAQMKSFAEKMQLDEKWTLLRSDEDDVAELAAILGVKYKQEKNGDISHSNIISVLNQDGEITYQLEGLGQDVTGVVDVLKKLAGPM